MCDRLPATSIKDLIDVDTSLLGESKNKPNQKNAKSEESQKGNKTICERKRDRERQKPKSKHEQKQIEKTMR